ncbi:MFS transporter [Streptomyces durmitorensis]|uniref:MFS transporter n=1 Tax=Streptomyces durmitorensis TaxID=319947 RepID=A0ABY4Q0P3_9ACTN|nr:MFS transporter [Streptomyces durmitorensis]UQT59114.1 MFS transporter [Streptomyces durmitorensis]
MTTTPIRTVPPTGKPAHRDGNVLRWLGAYSASAVGDNVYYLALSWAVIQSGSPTQAGVVMAVSAVPRALLMLGGGVVADRFGPRRVVIGSDAVRCVAVFAVAALLLVASPGVWLLAGLGFVFGAVDALFMPAMGALPARITGRHQLARVQGMRGLVIRLANVVGAPIGGLGVALGGSAAAFGIAGLLFAVSLPLLLSVRIGKLPTDEGEGGRTAWRELGDGLRYIRRHRTLAPLMVVVALADLGFVGPLNIGLTLLADERGWGASGVGLVLAGFGAGAGGSALLLTVRGWLPRAGLVASGTCVAGAVGIGAVAYVPSLPLTAAMALLAGLLVGLTGALSAALAQTESDPAYVGRVTAVTGLVSLGVAPLTYPLTGWAVGVWGTAPVFTASAATCVLAGVYGLCSRGLRAAELPTAPPRM